MPDVLHSATTYVHQPWDSRLEYNSYADLKAGAGLTADMVGHIGLLASNNTLWLCEQFTPYIKWSRVTGNDETEASLDLYVAKTSGTSTGEGTQSDPIDDFPSILPQLPKDLKHTVHVHVMEAGAYTLTESIVHKAFEGGQLSLDASNVFVDISAGPHTATGWTAGGPSGYEYGVITVAGTPFTPNEFKDYFVEGLTGTGAGTLAAVISNTNNTIRIAPYGTGFAVSDTFKIVEPGADLTVTADIGITVEEAFKPANSESSGEVSRFCMIGFNITNDVEIWFKNTNAWLQYCKSASPLRASNCHISDVDPYNYVAAIDRVSFRSVWDTASIWRSLYINSTRIYNILCQYIFCRDGTNKLLSVGVRNTGIANGILIHKHVDIQMDCCYFETPTKYAVLTYDKCLGENLYFESCSYGIVIKWGTCEINTVGGNSSNISSHFLYMDTESSANLDTIPTCTGVTGDIYWRQTDSTDNYPTAGNATTDSQGDWVRARR